MRQKIINCISSAEFANLLGISNTYKVKDYGLLQVKTSPNLKIHKGGLYFLYDENTHNLYTSSALWYLGMSGNTKTESMRDRNIKHRRHALQLKSKSGNNLNWSQFNSWLTNKGHAGERGIWDTHCKVLWIDIDNKQLSKSQLQQLEKYCINNLNPIVNNTVNLSVLNSL